jgi:hypothetical protein
LLRSRSAAVAPAPTAGATHALTRELVTKQLRLARAELDDKNYRVAITEATGVLKLAPGQPDARAIISAAQDKLDELERSVADARRLVEAGDTAAASNVLGHLLELDPRHPAAAELSGQLNSAFRAQAQAAAVDLRRPRVGGEGRAAPEPCAPPTPGRAASSWRAASSPRRAHVPRAATRSIGRRSRPRRGPTPSRTAGDPRQPSPRRRRPAASPPTPRP